MNREHPVRRKIGVVLTALTLVTAACAGGDEETVSTTAPADSGAATQDSTAEDTEAPAASDGTTATTTATSEGGDTGDAAAPEPGSSQPIRLGIQLEPATMDLTADPSAGIPQVLLYNVYETLVQLTPAGEIEPLLAESWEISEDGLTYTFKLRPDVTFHGGEELTAADVVYSIENVKNKQPAHPFQSTFEPIETVTVVDDHTVEIVLSKPSANLLFFLTQGQGVILDSEGAGDLAGGANGTGPFTFTEWVVGDHITLTANPDYWGDMAAAPSVEFRYIPDENALTNAALSGEVDIVPNVSAPELLTAFESDPNFTVEVGDTYGEIVLSLNGDNPPLDDVRVRQAITHAIDSEAIRDLAYGGYGTLIGTFSTPLDPYFKDNNDVYPYDPDRARELLAEAGVSDLTLEFVVPPTSYATRSAEIIQSQLAEVGITVNITNLDAFGPWIERVFTEQDYDMSIVAHVEPNDLAQYGNPDYYWGNDSPAVADLIAQADAESDPELRNALYQQALDEVTAQAADTWLFVLPQLAVVDADVTGYEPAVLSLPMAGVSINN